MKKTVNQLIILGIVCVATWGFLYVYGQFGTLHPDAYRDLTRSVVGVYLLVCIGIELYSLKSAEKPVKWSSPFQVIALSFTAVTVVNTVMMVTGIDTPKIGRFAFVHMLTRLGIVAFVVSLCMLREWREAVSTGRVLEVPLTVSTVFTGLTAIYCVLSLIVPPVFTEVMFYWSLLALWGISGAIVSLKRRLYAD